MSTAPQYKSARKPKIRVGLYGLNGHQVHAALVEHEDATLVSVAQIPKLELAAELRKNVVVYDGLEAMLANEDLDLVVLCSPRRSEQAADAMRCLDAGCSVLAEKPCVLEESDLDALIAKANASGVEFWEMSGLLLEAQFAAMRARVVTGTIGDVVQVLVQKSYPWADWRPDDEAVDGGIACQVGIYGARFAEYVAGVSIADLQLKETLVGNGGEGSNCRRAVEVSMQFDCGAIGTAVCNYCNPIGDQFWGYDRFQVFGTKGIIEFDVERGAVRLLESGGISTIPVLGASETLLDVLLHRLRYDTPIPMSSEEALRPTRWVLRGKQGLRV